MALKSPSPLKAPRISASSATSNSLFYASNRAFSVNIGERNTNKPVIEYALPEGNKISFSFKDIQGKQVTPKAKDKTVTFFDVSPNIDIKYTTLPTGLKEEIVLKKQISSHIFTFNLNATKAYPQTQTDVLFSSTFFDDKGNYLFHFEKPFAIDSNGSRTDNVSVQIKRDIKTDSYFLTLNVDRDWFESKDRVYPIVVDPTIVHDTSSEFATGQFNRSKDTGINTIPVAKATGGTITYVNGYAIHTFTSGTSTFTPTEPLTVDYLVVAGGGAGGNGTPSGYESGGGGAGGFLTGTTSVTATPYTVTVGAGGAARTSTLSGNNGENSVFGSVTATGGGGGASSPNAGNNGGSGGGGSHNMTNSGTGIAGQGFAGAKPIAGSTGGGGGGATAAGGLGNGGAGQASSISGYQVYYAGGGGGSRFTDVSGGIGGGGAGVCVTCGYAAGTAGTANTGGGGGGANIAGGNTGGGAGGSGIVIIRYYVGFSDNTPYIESYYQELKTDPYTVGLWHFNETTGNALDSSGNGNTGTPTGTTIIDGLLSKSRSFNGISDFIDAGTGSLGGNISVEFWIKPQNISTDWAAFVNKQNTTNQRVFWIGQHSSDGYIRFGVYLNGETESALDTDSAVITNGNWYHIAGTYDGHFQKIYVNGILVKTSSDLNTSLSSKTSNYWIGKGTATYPYSGLIDEVRISNIARTPEEIKLSASRRPYSTYTSDVLDLTNVSTWNPLIWSAFGMATGDGETATGSAQSALVAQWNFNETSGTTAVSGGSCGTSCNGTVTNMTTTSQDAAPLTGWTANNRLWGAGALMFDGSNDFMTVTNHASLNPTTEISVESWFKLNTIPAASGMYEILGKSSSTGGHAEYDLALYNNAGAMQTYWRMHLSSSLTTYTYETKYPFVPGKWYHIVGTYNSSAKKMSVYINGIKIGSDLATLGETIYSGNLQNLFLGVFDYNGTKSRYLNGILDSTRIYNRSLTPSEILSNYNSSRIEIQTRVGNTSTSNDGTWEVWKPFASELAIDSMDSSNISTSGCTGGTSIDGGKTFIFTSNGTFTCTGSGTAEVLVVGGGGGGGMDMGGGGGGGGVVNNPSYPITANAPYSVIVGAGGSGAPAAATNGQTASHQYVIGASNGKNSLFVPNLATYGSTSGTAGKSCYSLMLDGITTDGVYWIDPDGAGTNTPFQAWCDMNYDGGGWTMLMKATRGTTFSYAASYWTTANTLNPTDITLNDADAKYRSFNEMPLTDIMARWPDIANHRWLRNSTWAGVTALTGFNTYANWGSPFTQNYWNSAYFSTQTGAYVHGTKLGDIGGAAAAARWGNRYNNEANWGSDDVSNGIGLINGSYSAGDYIGCCQVAVGMNRSARVEVYGRNRADTADYATGITALGGGAGGSSVYTYTPGAFGSFGGSGGGASGYSNDSNTRTGGLSLSGNGFSGGNGGGQYYSGGGGGAGGPGTNSTAIPNGGVGFYSDILGPGYYWGGGGGGAGHTSFGGNGGPGGGGGGASWISGAGIGGSGYNNGSSGSNAGGGYPGAPGGNGGTNTGGGGGGGSHYNGNNKGGDGGSGIVVVRTTPLSTDTNTKTEGTGSQKISTNITPIDLNTIGFWRFDETSGAGSYLKNSSTASAFVAYGYTGADQTYTVPAGVTSITVKMWGGGGGGGAPGGWSYGFPGGGGGYTTGTIAVTPGQVLTVMVGGGGTNGTIANTLSSYGGGGRSCNTGSDCRYGGQGGGRSAIRVSSVDILTAGGGGGGGSSRVTNGEQGGAGGGINGINGVSYTAGYFGGAGTQTAGGAAASGATAGSQYQGGFPASNGYGGGGGGGWFGGGGGGYLEPNDMGGGGGGSGYISGTGVTNAFTYSGNYNQPANTSDPFNGGSGYGGAASTNGTAGKVVITANNISPLFHATPNGTTVVDGIYGKARYFNGSSDYVSVTNTTPFDLGSAMSLELWVKPGAIQTGTVDIVSKHATGNGGFALEMNSTANSNVYYFAIGTGSTYECYPTPSFYLSPNTWHYVAITKLGTTINEYVDGAYVASCTTTVKSIISNTDPIVFGKMASSTRYWNGSIDEVRISNVARSAGEISETYRGGRDRRITKSITLSDLSTSNKLPFFVASDRLGTFSQLTIGESALANYEPDSNTVGLWHLEEQAGDGAYLKDISGNGNHGTPTGTTYTQGIIGKARYFNGTNNVITTSNIFFPTGNAARTIEAWVNPNIITGDRTIAGWGALTANNSSYINQNTNYFRFIGYSNDLVGPANIIAEKWYYVVATHDGTTTRLFVNGVEVASGAKTLNTTATSGYIGSYIGPVSYFSGLIDEVRISNIARTADEIRQAYEIGSRTHSITIDFKASLGSGNLITGSGDLGFTVDERPYGATLAAGNIFLGDKIIVKENVNGTEYIAQGVVNGVNSSTGALTVTAWDSGSTFPSSGYTVNATVFKWQREYFDITNSLSTQRDAITKLTYRITDGSSGANIWLDDIKSSTGYLTDPTGSTITSSLGKRYFQYRAILSQNELSAPSAALTSLTLDYIANEAPSIPTLSALYLHDKVKVFDTTPEFRFSATDPESDDLIYQFQHDTTSAFTSPTTKTSGTDAGFLNVTTPADTSPFNAAENISYTFPSPLTNNTTYFYRVRVIDEGGTIYSSWSEIRSFTIDTSISKNRWFETMSDQFATDTLTNVVNDSATNSITLYSQVINNADTVSNWTSSVPSATQISQETTIKQEGTGSVKATTISEISLTMETMDYSTDNLAQSTYVSNNVGITASGGTQTTDGAYYVHTFTSSGTFAVSSGGNANVLVVGGGGSGGADCGGGGGSGGVVNNTNYSVTTGNKTVTIGGGSQNSVFDSLTANAGGNGGSLQYNGNPGGSGGGGGGWYSVSGTYYGGAGSQGGNGGYTSANMGGAGGGGGGGNGNNTSTSRVGAQGGIGFSSSISGTTLYYGGGGGGGAGTTAGAGGNGGGGNGAVGNVGANGAANTGGGGGGGGSARLGGSGGSGIVVVRYPIPPITQTYSESTIKTQGSYSLKVVAKATNSLNKTLTRTVSSPIDLSNHTSFSLDIRSTRTGSNIKVGLHDSGGTTTEITPNVTSANTFQTATLDISGVSNANKDAIDSIIVTIVNADADNTFYIDNLVSIGSSINNTITHTKTATDLSSFGEISFFVRSTLAGSTLRFQFGETTSEEQTYNITINNANTWERKTWDISGITGTARDAVTQFAFKILDATNAQTFYFDDINVRNSTGSVLSTPITATNIVSATTLWGSLEFNDTVSANITHQIYYNNSGTPTIVPDSALTGNSTGFTTSPVSLVSLSTVTYPTIYIKSNLTNSDITPVLYDWTIILNIPPNTPSLDFPTDTSTRNLLSTVFKTTATDAHSDYLRYKIEICTDALMTTGCQIFDQTTSQAGWSGQTAQSNTAYSSGSQATYTMQTPFPDGSTYYWRTYAIDPGGSNSWSSTQATPFSFTTDNTPETPSLDSPLDGAIDVPLNTVFKTTTTDADSDYLRYKLIICHEASMAQGCQTFDQTSSQTGWSGQNTQTNTAYTSGTQATYTMQNPLLQNKEYFWKTYAIDPEVSPVWSATQTVPFSFTTKGIPSTPSPCTIVKSPDNTSITINWTDSSNEDYFQVWKVVNGGLPAQLGANLAADTIQLIDSSVSINQSYGYLIRGARTDGSNTLYSNWCPTSSTFLSAGSLFMEGINLD